MWNSGEIAKIVNGRLHGNENVSFCGCSVDSRKITPGEIFIALAGEKVDGHDFIDKAYQSGANVVLAEEGKSSKLDMSAIPEDRALILVANSLDAFQRLARAWRDKINPVVIGITGSNGKTTTKDMVAAVLGQKYKVHKNAENHNTDIGLPMTILKADEDTEILVLEMGMRGLGQIKTLCEIARPDTGVITNIGTTHLELLGTCENIAEAKWELIESLPASGTAVLNTEDFWSIKKSGRINNPIVFYGTKGEYKTPDIFGGNFVVVGEMGTSFDVNYKNEKFRGELPIPGEHNILDALAALGVGMVYGVSLEKGLLGLKNFKLSGMRLEILDGIDESRIISDVYNANPVSMKASLEVLKSRGGEKTVAVLGEMYELGEAAVKGHCEVGIVVGELQISELVVVGKLAENIALGALQAGMEKEHVHYCSNCEEALEVTKIVLKKLGSGTSVLVKGSRGMKMENISLPLQKKMQGV
ncbi:MAG: UDP-N-acetylmuramoyl-tripeptide--D-alanyl-D-alanine ligase [Eubacteriales bacterium]